MKRVMILGPGNAGKSTFAVKLGRKLKLPVVHLDHYIWKENWTEVPKANQERAHERLIKGDKWVIEGGMSAFRQARIERADTIIYLDQPRRVSLYRWLGRIWKYRNTSRPDVGGGNTERFNLEYLGWISKHRYKDPQRLSRLQHQAPGKQVIVLTGTAEANDFIADR